MTDLPASTPLGCAAAHVGTQSVHADDNEASTRHRRARCFWALLSNRDMHFLHISPCKSDRHEGADAASRTPTSACLPKEAHVGFSGMDVDAPSKPTAPADCRAADAAHDGAAAVIASEVEPHPRCVDPCRLLGTSFFDHVHPEEVAVARTDLGHFVAQKTFYGSITRCRFRIPEAVLDEAQGVGRTDDEVSDCDGYRAGQRMRFRMNAPILPALSHDALAVPFQSITPLTTPLATRTTCYFDQTSAVPATEAEVAVSPPRSSICSSAGARHTPTSPPTLPTPSITTCEPRASSLNTPATSHMGSSAVDTYVVMDVTMSVVCDTVALAFFHVVDSRCEDCCDALLSPEDIARLSPRLNNLSPPTTPVDAHFSSEMSQTPTLSTRVLQIFTTSTGRPLFTYPQENLRRLTAGSMLPPTDADDWLGQLFHAEDYRKLHEKVTAARCASGHGHEASRHVCSRLRYDTVYGTRVAECVVSSWGQLTFVCTQLVGDEAEMLTQDGTPAGVGETRLVAPVGPLAPAGLAEDASSDEGFGEPLAKRPRAESDSTLQIKIGALDVTTARPVMHRLATTTAVVAPVALPTSVSKSPDTIFSAVAPVAHAHPPVLPLPVLSTSTHLSLKATSADGSGPLSSSFMSINGVQPQPALSDAMVKSAAPTSGYSPTSGARTSMGYVRTINRLAHQSTVPGNPYPQPYYVPSTPEDQRRAPLASPRRPNSYPPNMTALPFTAVSLRQHNSSGQMNSEGKQCESCGTMRSPEWRRGPSGHKTLCNACGLRYSRSLARAGRAQAARNSAQQRQSAEMQLRHMQNEGQMHAALGSHAAAHSRVSAGATGSAPRPPALQISGYNATPMQQSRTWDPLTPQRSEAHDWPAGGEPRPTDRHWASQSHVMSAHAHAHAASVSAPVWSRLADTQQRTR
ncbi:hypothetical protein THASP1DRAFT_25645 [Thamnocephalis sphaerospora]|uniref:GATA-type domain-containing protein n=1 Tax=Thamnocephalis sphaerospora TaxID=78915 RepID=A0A4P9XJK5_9FUNG|nr:hypothetical protein THASP1DRAFT_25645 [Thamnocephalis sphaerospora]|eukprot:RKP05948.1 hypothetical protein THASP1DRAFT_25645 [Thamnocephalis sphaerospora]